MTTDVPSWIPSVEEMFAVCEDHVYEHDAEAIRALVAERHRQHEESIVHAREQLDRERKKRGVVEDPRRLAEMALEVERKHPGIHMRAGWPELPVIAAALVAERAAQAAPERQEKAGEELYTYGASAVNPRNWVVVRPSGTPVAYVHDEAAAKLFTTELNALRAPAQPARSTREDGLREARDLILALGQEYGEHPEWSRTCVDALDERLRDGTPAREKDGEAFPGEIKQQTATRAAPRSPSPLSASTTSDKEDATRLAWATRQARDKALQEAADVLKRRAEQLRKHAATARDAGRERVAEHRESEALVLDDLIPDILALVSAPSIAQQAEPSVAGVPTVDDVMDAYNAGTTRFDEDLTLAHSAMTALEFTAARQRAGFAAVRALCLASRGARGTEDFNAAIQRLEQHAEHTLRYSSRDLREREIRGGEVRRCIEILKSIDAAPSRGERREDPSAEYMDAATCLRATAFVMLQAIRSNVPVAPDILDSIMPDIERMDTAREEMGLSALALVERDAALEEAARVCDEEVESANRSIASLPPREHELLEHAECSRLVAKLLAARVRAMKSTPAPSSASVTPKNDGGAE